MSAVCFSCKNESFEGSNYVCSKCYSLLWAKVDRLEKELNEAKHSKYLLSHKYNVLLLEFNESKQEKLL